MKTHLKNYLLTFIFSAVSVFPVIAQQNNLKEGEVIYAFKSNGKEIKKAPPLKLFFRNNIAHLVQGNDANENEDQYIDYNQKATYQILTLKNAQRYTLKTPFSTYEKPVITGDTATILGYSCKKANVTIRSNSIEIWFTNKLPIKGSPALGIAPDLGLILKIVRNGNFETYATKVQLEKVDEPKAALPGNLGEIVNEATYRRHEIDNRFTVVPIFSKQQINFTDSIINPVDDQENVTYRYTSGTVILKKIKLPDSSNHSVFVKLTEQSNGDAYDRTGSVFIIPTNKQVSFLNALKDGIKALPVYNARSGEEYQGIVATSNYLPPLELIRFFTPFGVKFFNKKTKISGYNWADSVVYKQDITDLLPRLKGEVWIGVFIGNYDKGGHKVSLELELYPQRTDSGKKQNWVMPVFNTLNLMEMAGQNYGTLFANDSLTVEVDIPEGLKKLTLRYITTGHGGWGNGDEFNQKENEIFEDSKKIFTFIPWRTDCGTYRLFNPSSGNFSNGLSSSDLSRSNWCPGTTTNPVFIPVPDLTPGKHIFKVAIPLGKREGTSFSAWNVSGVLIGEFK